ncbi:MAG TPA: tRNA pseudouridine(38-40) synthase TruA [Candidatus Butyricimonas faecavium]|nr:tRNA pseudouridine(38-40) synthase TruA [Candidatus Butyricimonas faecavium]
MHRYFIELAYNGSGYNGWQIQPNAHSVQEEINKALSLLLKQEINVTGAGRTDTGVHASFFVAHFESNVAISHTKGLVDKLNRFLGKNIVIKDIYAVLPDMHARFSAISRTYKYYINKNKDPFTYPFSYRPHPLPDIRLMNKACELLTHYEDFTSFSKLHTDVKTNICHLIEANWEETNEQLVFTIKADRFLRNMVRAIVGTLLDVGQKRITLEQFQQIIESKDRCKAGTSVPGNALFLCDIEYPPCKL